MTDHEAVTRHTFEGACPVCGRTQEQIEILHAALLAEQFAPTPRKPDRYTVTPDQAAAWERRHTEPPPDDRPTRMEIERDERGPA